MVFLLVGGLLITVGALLHVLFSDDISNLTIEILAAVVGVVLVIVSVAVTIHFQVGAEMEREFHVELFKTKVQNFENFISTVMAADDDDVIKREEIEQIRNLGAKLSLFSSKELVQDVALFIDKIRAEETLALANGPDGDEGTFRSVVSKMRRDLAVIDDASEEEFKEYVRNIIERKR